MKKRATALLLALLMEKLLRRDAMGGDGLRSVSAAQREGGHGGRADLAGVRAERAGHGGQRRRRRHAEAAGNGGRHEPEPAERLSVHLPHEPARRL